DACELERAKRKLTQLLQGFGDRHPIVPDFLEERLQPCGIHRVAATIQHARHRGGFSRYSGCTSACGSTLRMLATSVSNANGLRTSSLARSGRCTWSALSTITGMRCSV